jgi:hypothetical protein
VHGSHVSCEVRDAVWKADLLAFAVLWRGCGSGCLDFLENKEDNKADSKSDHTFKYGTVVGDEEFEFSDIE